MIALVSICDPAIGGSHLSGKNLETLYGHSHCSRVYLNHQDLCSDGLAGSEIKTEEEHLTI